jgi:S1-C subfamily serine protease
MCLSLCSVDCFSGAQEICDRVWCNLEKWFNNWLLLTELHGAHELLTMSVDANASEKRTMVRARTVFIVLVIIGGLFAAGFLGYSAASAASHSSNEALLNRLSALQSQISNLQSAQSNVNKGGDVYVLGENVSFGELYKSVKDSVVIVRGVVFSGYDPFFGSSYSQVQGSGFVYNQTGEMVVVTNYHVVQDAVNVTVTFSDGDGYPASVLGSDPYSDITVLSTNASSSEYVPLELADLSGLSVGDPVVAIGNPYGLAGSMTTGIVSALGRTITEEMSGSYPIANVIQTSAAINPGNSGGPLLDCEGHVIGITTAIVSSSQGLGFAIPSTTIMREIGSLVSSGSYSEHPWLGASGTDMTYEISAAMGTDVTYGWLIAQVTTGGPAANAGLQGGTQRVEVAGSPVWIGGDIITSINGTRIMNLDSLSTYLEEYTSPSETISVSLVRNNQTQIVSVVLGTRPAQTQSST